MKNKSRRYWFDSNSGNWRFQGHYQNSGIKFSLRNIAQGHSFKIDGLRNISQTHTFKIDGLRNICQGHSYKLLFRNIAQAHSYRILFRNISQAHKFELFGKQVNIGQCHSFKFSPDEQKLNIAYSRGWYLK